jgi:hypothetical protein
MLKFGMDLAVSVGGTFFNVCKVIVTNCAYKEASIDELP